MPFGVDLHGRLGPAAVEEIKELLKAVAHPPPQPWSQRMHRAISLIGAAVGTGMDRRRERWLVDAQDALNRGPNAHRAAAAEEQQGPIVRERPQARFAGRPPPPPPPPPPQEQARAGPRQPGRQVAPDDNSAESDDDSNPPASHDGASPLRRAPARRGAGGSRLESRLREAAANGVEWDPGAGLIRSPAPSERSHASESSLSQSSASARAALHHARAAAAEA